MKRSIKKVPVVALLGVVALSTTGAHAYGLSNHERTFTEGEAAQLWSQVEEVMQQDPENFAAIEAKVNELYSAEPLQVAVEGIDGVLTAQEATRILDAQAAEREQAAEEREAAAARGEVTTQAIPLNAFSVAFAFVPRPNAGYTTTAGYGTWNLDNSHSGGGAPHDVATMQFDLGSCVWLGDVYAETYMNTAPDDTMDTGAWALRDSGVTSDAPVIVIDDSWDPGLPLRMADRGYMLTNLNLGCGPTEIRGAFTYEHNEGGGAIANVSVGWGFLTVGYSGGGVQSLQKSSPIATHRYN